MKYFTALFLMLLISVFSVFAQNKDTKKVKPNFSGTWLLQSYKTGSQDTFSAPKFETIITITYADPELNIKRTVSLADGKKKTEEFVYFTDGKGETNPSDIYVSDGTSPENKHPDLKTKTKWDGDKIYSWGNLKMPGGSPPRESTETWEVSKDGKELTRILKLLPSSNSFGISRPGSSSGVGIRTPARPYLYIQKFKRAE